MQPDIAIRTKNLSKTYQIYTKPHDRLLQFFSRKGKQFYREHWALNDVSFEIRQGETLGIIGCNGSGKSTLLQIICGTLSPTHGEVEISGRIAALLELGAGFNTEFSGIENIYLTGQLYGLTQEEIQEKEADIIAFAGIGDFVFQPVKTYSSGMFVRLAFAIVAHVNPKILVVDEALAVGDFLFQQKCARFMRDKMLGITKILVSHDLSAIASMADRVLVLHKGQAIYLGDPQTAITEYQRVARGAEAEHASAGESVSITPATLGAHVQWMDVDDESLSGNGRAKIRKISWSIEGEHSALVIKKNSKLFLNFLLEVNECIETPIIGYQIQNRFGTAVFGENTLSCSFSLESLLPGIYNAQLVLTWPQIEPGEYGLTLGIGNGLDSTAHIIECWAHNVIVLGSAQTDPVHGIFNNPIDLFTLTRYELC